MNKYTLYTTTRFMGNKIKVTNTVVADSLEDAVNRLFINLEAFGWTKDMIREELDKPSKEDWDNLDKEIVREQAYE